MMKKSDKNKRKFLDQSEKIKVVEQELIDKGKKEDKYRREGQIGTIKSN